MKHIITIHLGLLAVATAFAAGEKTEQFKTRVVASGLHRPTGIAIQGNHTIYFTEVPTPGVSGMNGGSNSVSQLSLFNRRITRLHTGEPEPVNIIVGQDNDLYWTCKSAGVILTQDDEGETSVFLSGLQKPSGIGMDRCGNIYFTQVPTPGVNGMNGGLNNIVFTIGTNQVVLNAGEPEPVDIVVARNGDAYWTCKSAGVILERSVEDGRVSPLLTGLNKPVGIAIDREDRNLYFTEVPTPGVGGMNGGENKVWQYDLKTGVITLVNSGDPEPTDLAVSRSGNIYWTCTSAGVIVEARRKYGRY
ncbi:MAG: hypothetical protein IPK15_14980 [Verrucomicrobia bacterium]|nr:hypothetical protein [Verrucomicrobiota bacterium]